MNPFIVFLRLEWMDWYEDPSNSEPIEQQNVVVMDNDVFYERIKHAFNAALEMNVKPENAFYAPEVLLEAYMNKVYGR